MPESLNILLARWRDGDNAAGQQVFANAHAELRKLAAYYFRRERPGHTLQPTALVHEVFMKISSGRPVQWQNRAHFFAVFAQNVRQVLVDHARKNKAMKRQAEIDPDLGRNGKGSGPHYENLLTVHRALEDLETAEPRLGRVVELRIFGGLNDAEIASALGVSVATVKRDWTAARAWLLTRLRP